MFGDEVRHRHENAADHGEGRSTIPHQPHEDVTPHYNHRMDEESSAVAVQFIKVAFSAAAGGVAGALGADIAGSSLTAAAVFTVFDLGGGESLLKAAWHKVARGGCPVVAAIGRAVTGKQTIQCNYS